MHKGIFFFFLLFCGQYCQAQFPQKTNIEIENLNGKPKSVATMFYDADEKFGEIVKTQKDASYFEDFNKQGNYTEFERKNIGKTDSYTKKYKYNDNLVVEIKYKSSTYSDVDERLYNKLGQLQEKNIYSSNGSLVGKTKYKWRSFFNMLEYTNYNSAGKVVYKITYQYNANVKEYYKSLWDLINNWAAAEILLNVTVERKFDENDKLMQFRYIDSKGNEIVKATLIPKGKASDMDAYDYTVSKYNEKNVLYEYYKSYKSSTNGKRTNTNFTLTLDEFNNVTKIYKLNTDYDTGNIIGTNTYTYDSYNNWISRVNTDFSNPSRKDYTITDRDIKYY